MRIQQATLARLADVPAGVAAVFAVLVLLGIYLVIVPVTWVVARVARGRD